MFMEQGIRGFFRAWAPTLIGYSAQGAGKYGLYEFFAVRQRLYKGIIPLWGRQIPYTMMKFSTFEKFVELTYKHVIPTPKEQCNTPLQLGVSFACGYVAGVFCDVVSHPADNLVSFLNNA
ncbi:putative mitochondrial carrier domain-containing protein [Rosa chinensis]|uniref:Putative mitochondrial carrier domain-containing protein n=1 Tax=Rosa chinensis TaxID=74649 RepID=A0A2P6RAN4_ROSCH|nr:putative mitochondrial carrier domain-containing protein [Rosa chinensis]